MGLFDFLAESDNGFCHANVKNEPKWAAYCASWDQLDVPNLVLAEAVNLCLDYRLEK